MGMSVYSNEIDLDVLKYAVEHYAADLSDEVRLPLLQSLQNLQQHQPNAARELCELVSQTEDLDRMYTLALTDLRQSYQTQERAKSAVLTADSNGMLNGLGSILDDVTATLKQIQLKAVATQATQDQLKILRALETHSLTLEDLMYRTGLSLPIVQSLVQRLRKQGYIDLLSAPLLHWIFPGLKPTSDRQQPIQQDDFLSLTVAGYFHLHPLIQVARRGNE
jgi:hypothetical protein